MHASTGIERRPSPDGRRPPSWTPPLAAGAYSRHPAWTDRTRWLAQVAATVRTSDGETARAAAHVAVDTLLRVAAADAAVADARTGRNVATAHDTVAALLGMSAKTVQRARTLLERLGLAVTVWAGRYLTVAERAAARARHGASQLRAASTRALISPKEAVVLVPVENVQLPRRGHHPPQTHLSKNLSTRVTARRKPSSRTPIPVGVQRLAAQLAQRMPWLARNRHIGALTQLLHRHRLDADAGWSAERLLHILELHNRAHGHLVPNPTGQRNPLGYLNYLLTSAEPQARPSWRKSPEPRAVAAWRSEDAERRQQIEAEDPALREAIIAQIRADITASRHRSGWRMDGAGTGVGLGTRGGPARTGSSGPKPAAGTVQP
jgi:hypothetical protein